MDYHQKYLKYKTKYLDLRENIYGGTLSSEVIKDVTIQYGDGNAIIEDIEKQPDYTNEIHNRLKELIKLKKIKPTPYYFRDLYDIHDHIKIYLLEFQEEIKIVNNIFFLISQKV